MFSTRRTRETSIYARRFDNTLVENSSSKYDGLEIRWKGSPLDNFSVTKVFVANEGNEEIRRDDIAPSNPLRLAKDENVSTNITDDALLIDFDFLNPKDSFLLEVVHTGASHNNISIKGEIMGETKPISNTSPEIPRLFLLPSFVLKFLADPRYRIPRGLALTTLGGVAIAVALMRDVGLILWILLILFGARSIYLGVKALLGSKSEEEDRWARFEAVADETSHFSSEKMKEILFDQDPGDSATS